MDFTPEYKDEGIKEEVSHKGPLFNPPKTFWRYSTQTKAPTSTFHIGDSLR